MSDQSVLDPARLEAELSQVLDPVFEKPMRAIGSLVSWRVDGTKVHLAIKLPSPSPTIAAKAKRRIEEACRRAGAEAVDFEISIETPMRDVMSDDPIPEVKNIILVMSGKGGVGKSTVATNLALALSRLGHRVGLLDADVYGPSIPTMMGILGHPVGRDGKIAPLERFGIRIMSIGFFLEDEKQAVIWRGPMIHNALQQFLRDVDWGALDFLVLDLPPGTGDVALTMAQRLKVTGVIIVTTPQEVALQDVYKAVSMCKRLNLPILGVVENMSFFVDSAGHKHEIFGKGGGQKVAELANAPLLGQIPLVQAVREQGDAGFPIVIAQPESEVAKVFLSIGEAVIERIARHHFERLGGERLPPSKAPARLRIIR
ncbi:MAG: P-loop NTPase [Sandaracinaceae bacterium]|nr:P-loop NTPase [Sandaracinaceae bacterium]MDW8246849.1 P-loop NTPase [Sandaracinaceae bacterium]